MLATKEELTELDNLESAKLLVISDSHGDHSILNYAVENYGRGCDALLFLGDGISDLFSIIESNYHVPKDISIIPTVVAFVRGNGDDCVYPLFTDETHRIDIPENEIISVCGKKLFLTHGHRFGVYYSRDTLLDYVRSHGCSAGLFGHTHVPYQERFDDDVLLFNPGSCARPRNYSDKSCAVLTVTRDSPVIEYSFYSL